MTSSNFKVFLASSSRNFVQATTEHSMTFSGTEKWSRRFCLFNWQVSGMNRSWNFLQLRLRIFFFIDLVLLQICDRFIRKSGGVLFKKWGGVRRGSCWKQIKSCWFCQNNAGIWSTKRWKLSVKSKKNEKRKKVKELNPKKIHLLKNL